MKKLVALDCEVYRNFFLALFKTEDGNLYEISRHNDHCEGDIKAVKSILKNDQLLTFNGLGYDIFVLSAYLRGWSLARIKELSDYLINDNFAQWRVNQVYPDLVLFKNDQIDLMGVTPLQASLKVYGSRIHYKRLQDLPIAPESTITEDAAMRLTRYCENDLNVTWEIYRTLKPQIQLRRDMGAMYGMNLLSTSDAQIAERVIRHELNAAGVSVEKRDAEVEPFKYNVPDFIKFDTPELQKVLDNVSKATFVVENGKPKLPKELNEVIHFDGAKYKLGIGGLHSQEKKQVVIPGHDELFGEYDVASMYPSIILGQNLYPKHLGEEFCDVYREIFNQRLAAKRNGNKVVSDALKLVLNSSYGKFGSQYSYLYSPELLIQTTVTGQLALLMLIERMVAIGAKVMSANTDGINVLMSTTLFDRANKIAAKWTEDTTYVLEWTPYEAVYARDVNNYIAFSGGKTKTKGAYELDSIRKGYSNLICTKAVIAYLKDGVPIEQTIRDCDTVTDFLTMRTVKGGALFRGNSLGKVVRWYVSTKGDYITYSTNGNKVAGSVGAIPAMNLPFKLPDDLDYDFYINRAYELLEWFGIDARSDDRKESDGVCQEARLVGI